jgi:hypothetical protein
MAVTTGRAKGARRFASALVAMSTVFIGACASEKGVSPIVPGDQPTSQFRPLAFTADINTTTGKISITAPTATTANAPTLSTGGAESPNLSLLGGEAVRLIPSNYQASAVGAFAPGKIRVTFDVLIENKLPGVKFITPTWPVAPAAGVILFPLDYVVTTTPGGVTGGDGNEVIVEQPRFGAVAPSIDWSGTGAAGSGAPYSFFNDTDCSLATSNDCFRWEAYDVEIQPLTTSSVRTVGFDIDATVGQFRARMIVAADLAAAGVVAPGTVAGTVTSAVRGPLSGVTVTSSSGQTAVTDAAGAYSLAAVNPGSRTITLSNLPAGCTAPAAQTVSVTSGGTATANFAVTCTGLPGTIAGTITSDNAGELLPNVTVTASTGGSAVTNATGGYSITGAGPGAGTITLSGLPSGCVAPATSYTLASGGSITTDIVVDCPVPPTPGYQYNTTWVNLPGGEVAVDIRIDMRTFNRADIADVTTSGVTGDPIVGAQITVAYDATKLVFNRGDDPIANPRITAAPVINGSVAGQVQVLSGATGNGITGNVGVVRLVFTRAAGGTTGTSVGTTTTLQVISSRNAGATVNILPNVVNTEGTFILPAPLP